MALRNYDKRTPMANFSTHLKASIISSATLSSVVLSIKLVPLTQVFGLFILGCLAGLIPDLDSDKSRSLHSLFTIFALVISTFIVTSYNFESLAEIWLTLLLLYGLIMLVVKPIFERFTVHRGSFHSIAAVMLVTTTTVNLSLWLQFSMIFSTLAAIYVLVGTMTHLILDECCSVDIDNRELKASFGSALKLIDTRYITATLFQCIFIVLNIYVLRNNFDDVFNTLLLINEALLQIKLLPNLDKYNF